MDVSSRLLEAMVRSRTGTKFPDADGRICALREAHFEALRLKGGNDNEDDSGGLGWVQDFSEEAGISVFVEA